MKFRFKGDKCNGVKVVALRTISSRTRLTDLYGYLAKIPKGCENDEYIQYSIVKQPENGKSVQSFYAGPGALVNHSCKLNSAWLSNQNELIFGSLESIAANEEITLLYKRNPKILFKKLSKVRVSIYFFFQKSKIF